MKAENELEKLFKKDKIAYMSLSYSRLSDYDRNGVKALVKRTFSESDALKMGSLVDDLLLNKSNFDKLYFVFDGTKPTATLGKLCDIILENYNRIPSKKIVLEIIKQNPFWIKYKDEKLIETFDVPEFWNYLKAQYKSKNKQLVTTNDLEKAEELVHILKTHNHSKNIFNNNYDKHNQFKLNIKYKGFELRGIIDTLIVNHKNKTVQIIDLKTGKGDANEFEYSILKWRYYMQEAVYMKAFGFICKTLQLKGYKLLPFQFLYISRYEKIPMLFTMGSKWHKAGIKGFTTKSGYVYRGIDEILEEIKWHLDNQVFNMSKYVYQSNGNILVEDNFIEINE